MSAKNDGDQTSTSRSYNAGGSLVAFPRPDEIVVPLRRDEFDILCEGGANGEKASRDLCVGIGATAAVGLVGVLATIDWKNVWQPGNRGWFIFFLLLFSMATTGSFVGAGIFHAREKKTRGNSPFSRIRARLAGEFEEPRTLDAAIEQLPDAAKRIRTADVQWQNVANLFWLGSDICWTLEMASNAPRAQILRGLNQSCHHASELGMTETDPGRLLSALKLQAESTQETAMNQQWRNDLVEKLRQVRRSLSGLAQTQQGWFRPNP